MLLLLIAKSYILICSWRSEWVFALLLVGLGGLGLCFFVFVFIYGVLYVGLSLKFGWGFIRAARDNIFHHFVY